MALSMAAAAATHRRRWLTGLGNGGSVFGAAPATTAPLHDAGPEARLKGVCKRPNPDTLYPFGTKAAAVESQQAPTKMRGVWVLVLLTC